MRIPLFRAIAIVVSLGAVSCTNGDSALSVSSNPKGTTASIQAIRPSVLKKGETATLTGLFGTAGQLYVGGRTVPPVTWGRDEIKFELTGDIPGGVVTVRVADDNGASNDVTVVVLPTLSGVRLESDRLTVDGENLCPDCPFRVGGTPAALRTATENQATVEVPAEASGGDAAIVQIVGEQVSNALSVRLLPQIDALSPAIASPGDTITLFGSHLGAMAQVLFVGELLPAVGASGRAMQFVIPHTAAIGPSDIRAVIGADETQSLTVSVQPMIRRVSPEYGPAGTSITLVGNFGTAAGGVTYRGQSLTPTAWTASSITVSIPSAVSAGAGALRVSAGGLSSAPVNFNCVPWIDGVSPAAGPPGTSIEISGRSFGPSTPGSTVLLNGFVTPTATWADTLITLPIPSSAAPGTNTVQIQVAKLSSNVLQVENQRPWIDARKPAVGLSGTVIHARGRYLGAGAGTATLGGFPASITGWTENEFFITVPDGVSTGPVALDSVNGASHTLNRMPFVVRGSNLWIPFGPPRSRSSASVVWSGTEMILWGGYSGNSVSASGDRYNPATDSWLPVSQIGAPEARSTHLAVWIGDVMWVYGGQGVGYSNDLSSGGRYNPATDAWTANAYGPAGDMNQRAFWTGSEVIVYGGIPEYGGPYVPTLALYNPVTNTWRSGSQTGIPDNSTGYSVVWTGTQLIVWGGGANIYVVQDIGGRYDPALDQWLPIGRAGTPPGTRKNHVAVWTGRRMLVWGGNNKSGELNDGGAYDPVGDRWEAIPSIPGASAPHSAVQAVWSGSEMLVWGGLGYAYPQQTVGHRYDPVQKTWTQLHNLPAEVPRTWAWTGTELLFMAYDRTGYRYRPDSDASVLMGQANATPSISKPFPAWTGTELLVWSGDGGGGWRYLPAMDQWTRINATGSPGARSSPSIVWTGTTLAVWGGRSAGNTLLQSGFQYHPATDDWTPMSDTLAPSARYNGSAALAGSTVVIWGGMTDSGSQNDGSRWNPATNVWQPLPASNAPGPRSGYTFVGTPTMVMLWGGYDDAYQSLGTGKRYVVADDAWTDISTTVAPAARWGHKAVWTGARVFIWGGFVSGQYSKTGAVYDPLNDTWAATTVVAATPASSGNTVIAWTGTEVFVWAGALTALYNPATSAWRAASSTGAFTNAQFAAMAGPDVLVFPEGWYVP